MALILAFDFGGTKLTAAVAETAVLQTRTPKWLAHKRAYSPANNSRESDLAQIWALADDLLAGQKPAAIGISFGGPVAYEQGMVLLSHHVPGWEQTPLAQMTAQRFGLPEANVKVDNDANAAALGEFFFGAGQGAHSLLYVTVSTGVGGGWILAERPYRGHSGVAGEIGHTVVDPAGPVCLCGKHGCVERLASGPYMAADLAEALGQAKGSLTGKDVAQLAQAGNPAAVHILRRGAEALGVGLGNAANLMNPARFILGGGVTKSGEQWWQWVRESARRTALPEVVFTIVPAALGDDAPLWGAVALVHEELKNENG